MQPEHIEPGSPEAWLRFARSDLALAATVPPKEVLPSTLCFHAQQAAEKAVKAVLIHAGVAFPRTHSIRYLLDRLPPDVDIPEEVAKSAILTKYAVQMRYPDDTEDVTENELQEALRYGGDVLEWAERLTRHDG